MFLLKQNLIFSIKAKIMFYIVILFEPEGLALGFFEIYRLVDL